ncbi:DUF92 domain-containing protein [Schinkia azotoformans]|uniref:DUF92 domain-containing protein n=1 Tax=Schinkia azotoformans LMG 9581 TaxID=1131731 RepID=K6CUP3_SCHAZ|nr:DUF92 domain-containing protein [Schinkia azotoformans]EKN63967.1 hypothetical protein BAZO_14929 [Schinkia azotoformans LMG 9581]MEC1640598.1 DUF92 domain-containing protein [Schinkia azotoformans]MEC1719387.1 DUF92 domain-containing protein [Schinkia azotoformans]MEC1944517.1 DUF92 domain-containing protein [Schinkia azotoformans]MED4353471.1 DUF92 domain-containing protein [Schinkia azotoformans]
MSIISNGIVLFILVVIAAISGYKLRALTLSGAIATIIVGLATLLAFGAQGLLLMGTFFVTSNFWSKFKADKKKSVEDKIKKSGARDAVQVIANGGVPGIISLLFLLFQENFLLYMFISSLATANSDTWASEIGSISKSKPVHILSFSKVDAGTSGAMSFLGTISALCGAFLIGIISHYLWNEVTFQLGLAIGIVGFIGNLIDTLLGATVQVTYTCPNCGLNTEKTNHCGQSTMYKSGYRFLNNDTVNFLSIALGSLLILLFTM